MVKARDSIVFPALIVLLIAIPAASQTVEIDAEGGYSGEIDSKFSDMFEIDFNTGEMLMEMVNRKAKLEVNQSYDKTVVKLETSQGFIKKVNTSEKIIEVVATPYGNFTSGVEGGENFSEFEGGNEERAEDIRYQLRKKLADKTSEAEERKRAVIDKILPDVSMEVHVEKPEHFNLTNTGEEAISLEEWTLVSSNSDNSYTYELEGELEPGKEIRYYSADEDDDAVTGGEDSIYGTGITLYNSNGEVKLYNAQDRIVDQFSN